MGKIDCKIFLLIDALKQSLKIKKICYFLNSNNKKCVFFLIITLAGNKQFSRIILKIGLMRKSGGLLTLIRSVSFLIGPVGVVWGGGGGDLQALLCCPNL